MTMATPHLDRPGAGIVWARVEAGFHVGSRAGDFVGYIDQQKDGRFLAFDARSQPAGLFTELTAAMRALAEPSSPIGADDSADRSPVELREVR